MPRTRILVGLSRTAADEGLLAYAAAVSEWYPDVTFRLAHVIAREARAALSVDELVATAPSSLGALADRERVSFSVPRGALPDALLQEGIAFGADLAIVGHRGTSHRRSQARRLAMQAPFPVLMVPDGSPARVSRVLAPVDFSVRSADALAGAAAIAARVGLESVDVLHVRFNSAAATFDEYDDLLLANEHEAFAIFVARIDLGGVEAHPIFGEGPDVARVILRTAAERDTDLIVMGTRGRSRAAAVLLGSETDHVLMHSRVPVLAVKHYGTRLSVVDALLDTRSGRGLDPRFT